MTLQVKDNAPGKSPEIQNLSGFVWSIAEILRGDFKQSEYGKVILPFVVLRRLDCILEGSKQAVLDAERQRPRALRASKSGRARL